MDDTEYGYVADFLENHWASFLVFMEAKFGTDELRCEDIVRALEEKAGWS
jgi:hypothetical protein